MCSVSVVPAYVCVCVCVSTCLCSVSLRIPNEGAERGAMAADAEGHTSGQSLFPELHTFAAHSEEEAKLMSLMICTLHSNTPAYVHHSSNLTQQETPVNKFGWWRNQRANRSF